MGGVYTMSNQQKSIYLQKHRDTNGKASRTGVDVTVLSSDAQNIPKVGVQGKRVMQ